jgi:hypothetical protein
MRERLSSAMGPLRGLATKRWPQQRRRAGGVDAVADDMGSSTTRAGGDSDPLGRYSVHAVSIPLCRAEGRYPKKSWRFLGVGL